MTMQHKHSFSYIRTFLLVRTGIVVRTYSNFTVDYLYFLHVHNIFNLRVSVDTLEFLFLYFFKRVLIFFYMHHYQIYRT